MLVWMWGKESYKNKFHPLAYQLRAEFCPRSTQVEANTGKPVVLWTGKAEEWNKEARDTEKKGEVQKGKN